MTDGEDELRRLVMIAMMNGCVTSGWKNGWQGYFEDALKNPVSACDTMRRYLIAKGLTYD